MRGREAGTSESASNKAAQLCVPGMDQTRRLTVAEHSAVRGVTRHAFSEAQEQRQQLFASRGGWDVGNEARWAS